MHIDQLIEQIQDENVCRKFFEKLIWPTGRICPHCGCRKSYEINGRSTRDGLYECSRCKRQFTLTTKTPMHSTKLPLWKWLLAIYYILNSSKGISSVFLARLIGVHQSSAWKMGHAIRQMIDAWSIDLPPLEGVIEMDEKFFGGKPRYKFGVRHKGGHGTKKKSILIAVQRKGPVRAIPMEIVKTATIKPVMNQFNYRHSKLMTDKSYVFHHIGSKFSSHESVYHFAKEFARNDVHVNTAESFNSILERTKIGVFHYMSITHLPRYLNELAFRWLNRTPTEVTRRGKKKLIWKPKPIIDQFKALFPYASGTQLRRTASGGIRDVSRSFALVN